MLYRNLAIALAFFAGFFPAAAQVTNHQEPVLNKPAQPPVAQKRDFSYTRHGTRISDPYAWLRDASYPQVDDADILDYLNAENAYFESAMAPHKALVETLFEEMKGRIKEDDSSVPQKDGNWLYWSEFEVGQEYRKHYRRPAAGGDAVLILDENELAEGKEYFRLGSFSVSKNGRYLAYSLDDDGSERFDARIKDLQTGELLPDVIPETLSGLTWVMNDSALVYGKATPEWRVDNARLHRLGTPGRSRTSNCTTRMTKASVSAPACRPRRTG